MHRRRAHGDGECSFVLLFCVNLVFCFWRDCTQVNDACGLLMLCVCVGGAAERSLVMCAGCHRQADGRGGKVHAVQGTQATRCTCEA
jgi:hypothetical protein